MFGESFFVVQAAKNEKNRSIIIERFMFLNKKCKFNV